MSSMEQGIRTLIVLPKGWRTSLGAISMLWMATALGAVVVFLTQALLAHALGPASYGLFVSSLAMVRMIAPLAGFGISPFWLMAYGAEGWAADRWLRPSLQFLAGTTLLTLAIVVLWAFTGAPSDTTAILLLLVPVVLATLAAG